MIKVQLKGFKELQDRLKKASQTLQKQVNAEIGLAATEIRDLAAASAADQALSGAGHQLIPGIVASPSESGWSVFSNADYSGYVEFGTRSKVRVPPELAEVAAQIRGSGSKTLATAKESIYAWCKAKGIERGAWWPIYVKIMTEGSRAHPFFFKQLDIVQPKLIKRLEDLLNKI